MPETKREQKRIAVVVGIGHYVYYHSLQYSPPSAEDVYDLLVSPKFGRCDPQLSIKKIVKEEQTLSLSELDNIVKQAIERVEPEDQFLFYFCGHGKIHGSDLFLILPESRKNVILDCYDFRTLVRKLKLTGVNKAIFIVDACHSSAMFSSIEELMDEWKPDLPKGFGFMAASGKFQYARQQAEIGCTIFSHYFCEGIKHWKDPRSQHIMLSELKGYINRQVKKYHSEADQTVHTLIQEGDHSLWVSFNPAYNRGTEMIDFKQKIEVGQKINPHASKLQPVPQKTKQDSRDNIVPDSDVSADALQIQFPNAVKCEVSQQDRKARIGRIELKNTGEKTIPAGWRGKIGLLRPIDFRVTLVDTIVLPAIPPGITIPIGPFAADVPRDIARSEDEWHLELYILGPQGNEELLFRSPNFSFV